MDIELKIQILLIITLFFSVIIHEVAHGLAALYQGDETAKDAGRITLNPISHIDLIGTIIVPAMFLLSGSSAFLAWAKPVPYNPHNLKNKKWGEIIVALAGPISNLILLLLFIFGLWVLSYLKIDNKILEMSFFYGGFLNLFLAIFNLIPIVPLDGSKVLFALLPENISEKVQDFMEENYLYIFGALILLIFNTSFLSNWTTNLYETILSIFLK